jgi:GGDEF domain-containing protein
MKAWPPRPTAGDDREVSTSPASRRAGDDRSPIDPGLPPMLRPRQAARPRHRPATGDPAALGRTAVLSLAEARSLDDPLTVSALRFARRQGHPQNPARLLAHWGMRVQGRLGRDTEYPWALTHDAEPGSPEYAGTPDLGTLWRPREADAYLRNPTAYGHRLVLPIVIAEALEFLGELVAEGEGEHADAPRRLLDDIRPQVEGEVAGYVQGDDPWRDTFLLWLLGTRPHALEMLEPLARALATRYATMASWTAGLVCGIRYPFDGTPLVSASSHLALGLWALGYNPRALPGLLRFVTESQGPSGGWADDGQPEDVLTTLAAADLLSIVDPAFDPGPAADFLMRLQEPGGWWRALDPEVPWLTGAVVEWLDRAERPFHERFRWPGYERSARDRRTRLPWWAAFGDVVVRTFERVPGLADARTEMAFLDLAGFGAFNGSHGQARGDEVLRVLGKALAAIPDCQALRDGGDEFILIGTPTHDGLEDALHAFRVAWASTFAATFGETIAPVPVRIALTSTTGGAVHEARTELGLAISTVKRDHPTPPPEGVVVRF